jgi:hypothetical protein
VPAYRGAFNPLELVYALYALGLFVRVNKAAKCSLEFLTTRTMSHPSQARTIPINLSSLRIECALLVRFLLESIQSLIFASNFFLFLQRRLRRYFFPVLLRYPLSLPLSFLLYNRVYRRLTRFFDMMDRFIESLDGS